MFGPQRTITRGGDPGRQMWGFALLGPAAGCPGLWAPVVPLDCEPTRSVLRGCVGTGIAFIPCEALQSQAEVPGAQPGSPPASMAQRPRLQSEHVRASGFDSHSYLMHPVAGIS